MSLNELLELKRKPWCDIEVEDLYVDGTLYAKNIVPEPITELQITTLTVGPTGVSGGFNYNTIQDALNNLPSSDSTRPIDIYIYGSNIYTENLSLPVGYYRLIGLDNSVTATNLVNLDYPEDATNYNSGVIISGFHGCTGGDNWQGNIMFQNITFINDGSSGNVFSLYNRPPFISLNGCQVFFSFKNTVINIPTSSWIWFDMNNTLLNYGLDDTLSFSYGQLFNINNGGLLNLNVLNSSISENGASIINPNSNLIFIAKDSSLGMSITSYNQYADTFNFDNCQLRGSPVTGNALLSFSGTDTYEPTITLTTCYDYPTSDNEFTGPLINFTTSGNGSSVMIDNCNFQNFTDISNVVIGNLPPSNQYWLSDFICQNASSMTSFNNVNKFWYGVTGQIGAYVSTGYIIISGIPLFQDKPLLIVTLSTTQNDATGDGSAYRVPFDNVLALQASSYDNTTGIYTIPYTGFYRVSTIVSIQKNSNTQTTLYGIVGCIVSARTLCMLNTELLSTNNNIETTQTCQMMSYVAGDTISVVVNMGGGAKTANVLGQDYSPTFYANPSTFSVEWVSG